MDGSKITIAILAAIATLCGTAAAIPASAGTRSQPAVYTRADPMQRTVQTPQLAARVLGMHNAERERLGLPRLKWNVNLEREAGQWAQTLSRQGMLQHADGATRNGTGENLWMGTAGAWPVETMVGMFLEERKNYRHASFPNISRTGNWADVGHYSQIVWRETREVGCAVTTGRGNDVLVCRYWPAGNVWGQKAY